MRRPRMRFTVRGLMVAVVVAAWAFSDRSTLARFPSPRSLVPAITAAYLTWALIDSVLVRYAIARRAWCFAPTLLCVLLGVHVYQRSVSEYEWMMAHPCGLGPEFRSELLEVRSRAIPTAAIAMERANLIRKAEEHVRREARHEHAAIHPWLDVEPRNP